MHIPMNRVRVFHRQGKATTFTLVIFDGYKLAYYLTPSAYSKPKRISYQLAVSMTQDIQNGFRQLHGNNRLARHCLEEVAKVDGRTLEKEVATHA